MRGGYRNDLSNWVAGFFLWHKSYSFVVSYIDVRVGTFVLKLSFGLVGGGVMMGLLGWGRTFFSFFFFLFSFFFFFYLLSHSVTLTSLLFFARLLRLPWLRHVGSNGSDGIGWGGETFRGVFLCAKFEHVVA